MAANTTPVAELPAQETIERKGFTFLALYSVAHLTVDLYSSALGVFQPLFATHLGVTLSQAGILAGVMIFAGSVVQPLYGYLSDRFHSRLFTVLAPAVAGLFIASLGLAPSYPWLLLLVFLGASGVASFHPQGSARAALDVPDRARGLAMSIFISSGSLGFALGPAFFSFFLAAVGFRQSYWAAIPGVAVTLLLLRMLPEQPRPAGGKKHIDWQAFRSVIRPLSVLYLLVVFRSVLLISFTQFLPLYLTRERGLSLESASLILSLFSTMGALGGFTGGHIADRWGGRNVILASMIGSAPFFLLFFHSTGWLATVAIALGGLVLLATTPVNIVMGQRLVPSQAGTVSALMMGFAWGMAGILFTPLVGFLADSLTLHVVLQSLTIFPILGFFLALRIPK